METMEGINGILSQENDYSSTSESDTEGLLSSLKNYNVVTPLLNGWSGKRPKVVVEKKRNGEDRMPTRRPDPNVYNRNALLARENRRKKKLYLESLERELQEARKANRALVKALKRQIKISHQLEQEKNHQQQQSATTDTEDSCLRDSYDSFSSSSLDPEPFAGIQCDLDGGAGSLASWDDNTIWTKADRSSSEDLSSLIDPTSGNILNVFDDHCYVAPADIKSSLEYSAETSLLCTDASLDGEITAHRICIHNLNRGRLCHFGWMLLKLYCTRYC